jgi:hypothetical protein
VFLNHRALPFAMKQNRLTGNNALSFLAGNGFRVREPYWPRSDPGDGATMSEIVVEGTSRFVAG